MIARKFASTAAALALMSGVTITATTTASAQSSSPKLTQYHWYSVAN